MAALRALPALPGTPRLEAARSRILLSAKAEPVLFLEPPTPGSCTQEVRGFRDDLLRGRSAAEAVWRVKGKIGRRREVARAVFLRDGYLYAETPGLGLALVEQVDLEDLFDAPELVILRGSARYRIEKRDSRYRYAEGPDVDEPARLLLYDRVWATGEDPGPARHVSVRSLRATSGADEVLPERLTLQGILAKLRYGETWVPSVLALDGLEVSLGCEVIPAGAAHAVSTVRRAGRERTRMVAILRRTIDSLADESLPFDEPKTEEGQQDGKLRPEWLWAYENGRDEYEVNSDRYQVFDRRGRPRVPQVCIDFILDTLERASGRWWRPRSEPRERLTGKLNFEDLGLRGRRSVDRFLDFTEEHPEWFELYRLQPDERFPLARKPEFVAHIYQHRDRYRPGDIMVVYGLRDDEKNHYHAFYIVDNDPLTGMPTLVASNAGRPRVRTWETEMRSAPKRSLVARVRPRLDWLASVLPSSSN
jgi:hypothetical protein